MAYNYKHNYKLYKALIRPVLEYASSILIYQGGELPKKKTSEIRPGSRVQGPPRSWWGAGAAPLLEGGSREARPPRPKTNFTILETFGAHISWRSQSQSHQYTLNTVKDFAVIHTASYACVRSCDTDRGYTATSALLNPEQLRASVYFKRSRGKPGSSL